MPLTFKTSGGGGDFKSVPSGSHIAICNLVADLGIQPGSTLYPAPKHQVYIRFEVPEERIEYERDGKKVTGPAVIGSTFTASMHEKANLRKQLEGWRGRKFTDEEAEMFDVSSILGKACMISVVETVKGDRVYSNITSIGSLPKGVPTPKPENSLIYFASDNESSFGQLPEWLQKKINGQIKAKADAVPDPRKQYFDDYANPEITDDDIPF